MLPVPLIYNEVPEAACATVIAFPVPVVVMLYAPRFQVVIPAAVFKSLNDKSPRMLKLPPKVKILLAEPVAQVIWRFPIIWLLGGVAMLVLPLLFIITLVSADELSITQVTFVIKPENTVVGDEALYDVCKVAPFARVKTFPATPVITVVPEPLLNDANEPVTVIFPLRVADAAALSAP